MKRNKSSSKQPYLLYILLLLSIFCGGSWICKSITFKQNCSGHLKRAANASTVELAQKELKIALDYLESNNMTSGSTHIIYATPDNDIEFWYSNIKAAYDEMKGIPPTTSLLEKTNVLKKLHESLVGSSDKGDSVIIPPRLSIYPYQIWIFLGTFIGIIYLIIWSKIWES